MTVSHARLYGWRLVGTDRFWPVMFGQPPKACGLRWEAVYRLNTHDTSYEWTTILVVSHQAGSKEGAIHQRKAMLEGIDVLDGCEVMAASTRPGDAAIEGLGLVLGTAFDEAGGDDVA